ncbi:MAG: ABC transporter ATP-binding protein [Lachnospiraceae bacterium]|nr:ABC transporter ATP-binding protein [Lachnospiraceae bacterium]
MILELKDICKDYVSEELVVPVLKDIHLQVEEGEYLAVMGPSGSGKTTLMNLLGCLDRPTSGMYFLEGQDVSACDDDELSDVRLNSIGFVFQNFHLLPKMTALDNVALPLSYAGIPLRERYRMARKALAKVGLEDRMDFMPNQLSGGQKQRVAIARAIINHPKILLADEPTGSLDSKSGLAIMELFRQLNEEGMTVIMITHNEKVARQAKRIIHLFDGEIIREETQKAETVVQTEVQMETQEVASE